MSTLLIDNYDSYTYNVFHLLAAVSGEEPIVVHNDVVSWRALSRWDFDAIVISPGPGRPERWHDFGVCSDILRFADVPVLGVCLGHQGLGYALEGKVASAPMVMHGRLSGVKHDARGLFAGIPQGFSVVRYHSLAVTGSLGTEGRITAWTDEGVVMGIEHRRRPMWGVQFHPESIATEYGKKLFENFYALARTHKKPASGTSRPPAPARRTPRPRPQRAAQAPIELRMRTIDGEPPAEGLFERLFGSFEHAFWLDSADAPTALAQRSYLGTTAGPNRQVLEYDVEKGEVEVHRAGGSTIEHGSIFDVLDRELQARTIEPPSGIARGLVGGFVGYLGYECKADCGSPGVHRSDVPDAVLMFANRIVAIDHVAQRTHLIALCAGDEDDAERWLSEGAAAVGAALAEGARARLGDADARPNGSARPSGSIGPNENAEPNGSAEPNEDAVSFRCGRGREQYLADIARCQSVLAAGESYEVCLTDQIHTDASPDPLTLYRALRQTNPAPFAAYLKLGELAV